MDSSALRRLIMGQGEIGPVERALAAHPTFSILASLDIRAAIYKQWHDGRIAERERDALLAVAEQRVALGGWAVAVPPL